LDNITEKYSLRFLDQDFISKSLVLILIASSILLVLVFTNNIHIDTSQGFIVLIFFILLYYAIFIKVLKNLGDEETKSDFDTHSTSRDIKYKDLISECENNKVNFSSKNIIGHKVESPSTCNWNGKSGKTYIYLIYPINIPLSDYPGNFIFCKKISEETWSPLYVSQATYLNSRIVNMKKERCAKHKGATHIHIRINFSELKRLSEASDLIDNHDPVCNKEENIKI